MKKNFALLLLGILSFFLADAQKPQRPGPQLPPETGEKFKLGMAGYTFAKFDLDKALETLKKMDVHYLCIKDLMNIRDNTYFIVSFLIFDFKISSNEFT